MYSDYDYDAESGLIVSAIGRNCLNFHFILYLSPVLANLIWTGSIWCNVKATCIICFFWHRMTLPFRLYYLQNTKYNPISGCPWCLKHYAPSSLQASFFNSEDILYQIGPVTQTLYAPVVDYTHAHTLYLGGIELGTYYPNIKQSNYCALYSGWHASSLTLRQPLGSAIPVSKQNNKQRSPPGR
jgi:hypothetical protein